MNHVNCVNQLRADLIIFQFQQFKWIKKMIEYMINSININIYFVWNYYQSNNDFSHQDRRIFIQKFIEKFLRNLNIIHQSSINIKSIYCVWNDCLMNKHTRPRKRQALSSININIQQRHDRRTFDYCMKCKVSLCVSTECFINYHETKGVTYEVLWCILKFQDYTGTFG